VEAELGWLKEGLEPVPEFSSEHPGKRPDGKEKVRVAALPAAPIHEQSATGHEAVQMLTIQQRLAPGVQHRRDADLCLQPLPAEISS